MDFSWAEVLGSAIGQVARSGAVGAGNEYALHQRLRDALRMARLTKVLDSEGRLQCQGNGWTRAPGGIDVISIRPTGDGERALGVECKVGKPDELLWDAIKLSQRCDDKPWNHGLEAAALVVEVRDAELDKPRGVRWFDSAVAEVDTVEAIGRWPEAWYRLMCGGRGIRPTSLPRTLRLGPRGQAPHAGGGSALCWRLVAADAIAHVDRVAVDAHGWPPQVTIPDEWRRKIDQAADTETGHPMTLPYRRTLDHPPDRTLAETARDEEGRLWTDVWATRETVPTSFRLSDTDWTRYDIRRAKNDALTFADPPKELPDWCSREVAEGLERFWRDPRYYRG